MTAPRFDAALAALVGGGVAFIVVGGVAAVLGGAPINTFDVDIVPARDDANVGRLLGALASIDACYRDLAGSVIRPDAAGLRGPGHHLLLTQHGPLDVLGTVGAGEDYAQLLPDTELVELGPLTIRVLGLAGLIRTKEAAGRPKDLLALPIRRRVLAERG
ncbi:MAG: hypothetical protein R2939_11165 [Kofleriaceae bacterium]